MTASTDSAAAFDAAYLSTWTESDPDRRRAMIEDVWAPDGQLHVSSSGATITGTADIAAHIDRVHAERIVGQGLTFAYDQHLESGGATLLRSSMLTAEGTVVGRGVDIVFRDDTGRVTATHMFMGVD